MLKIGSSGAAVKALQAKLGVAADGKFGPATQAALKAYQSKNGLASDGVAGPLTLGKMGLAGGAAAGKPAASAAASAAANDAANRAADLGWSQAVINSDPELKKAFDSASSQNWTTQRFVAEVRNTNWFKSHGEAARKTLILQQSDPATYQQQVAQASASVSQLAAQVGAKLTPEQLRSIGADTVMFGWSTDQIKQTMQGYINPASGSQNFEGQAGQYQQRFNQAVAQYGVDVSPQVMGQWVRQAVQGQTTVEGVTQWAQQQAMSKYPGLADRLKSGETMEQIVDPYRQEYAKTLEVNPNTVSLNDPAIQQALQAKDSAGKPTTQTVWEFSQGLRQDPRWAKTQQAQDQAMNMGRKVLQDFGLVT